MTKLFLIPGMGADTRIYNNIDLPDYEIVCINWIEPHPTDTLSSYSQKLIFQYNITPGSILIGHSLGGMIAIEMANFINIKKVILISSIRIIDEAPGYFSFFKLLPVYKLIPSRLIANLRFVIRLVFGKIKGEDLWLLNDMLKNTSPAFLKWSMGAVVHWDNKTIPPNVYQLIGDKDAVFSWKKQKGAAVIKGGTHIMILVRPKDVNKWLKSILKK